MSQYLFKLKTREGFQVKTLCEFLSNSIKFPHFSVNSQGLFCRATDSNREQLIDIAMAKENFPIFKCPKPLFFTINSSHLYRLLKSVKKKNSITMFIESNSSMRLGICIESNDENMDSDTTYINIVYVQPEEITLPEGYIDPLVIAAKKFQRVKSLHGIGNEMTISIQNQVIKFFVNGKNLYSRQVRIGEEEDEEERSETVPTYCQTFTTSLITQLTKCAGQSGNVQLFYDENLPLQLKMHIGTIGILTVYIKSKELIDMLENEEENEEEEGEEEENEEEEIIKMMHITIEDKSKKSKKISE